MGERDVAGHQPQQQPRGGLRRYQIASFQQPTSDQRHSRGLGEGQKEIVVRPHPVERS
jgi:hypothetical protein